MNVLQTLGNREHNEEYTAELYRLVLAQSLWMVVLFGSLQVLGALALEQYFVLSYVGFVVIVQLFAPAEPTTRWWRGVQVVVLLGFLGLCYFVLNRATDVVFV